jgi:hypothetical protein
LGDRTLGLLDDDAAVQRALQLLAEQFCGADRAFLEQADGCDVGQGLDDGHVLGPEVPADVAAEDVQGADLFGAQP